jgi:kinesin family member 15
LQGYNGTVFAYGQTGSGKTFTTFGPSAAMENALDISDPRSLKLRGLVPRVLEYLFDSISAEVAASAGRVRYNCRCSFYEIFNERVFDLLGECFSFQLDF